jgi:hypothetical protein
LPEDCIFTLKRLELPGYFRPEKKWDLLVVDEQTLVASVEFKSQIGPSFGNNFNNRSEEAIGTAQDIWTAYREGAFRTSERPWLGYRMLLEDCEKSTSPVAVSTPHFPVFTEFVNASYSARYQILLTRLLRERLYDSACFLLSPRNGGAKGVFSCPDPSLSFLQLAVNLSTRIRAPVLAKQVRAQRCWIMKNCSQRTGQRAVLSASINSIELLYRSALSPQSDSAASPGIGCVSG